MEMSPTIGKLAAALAKAQKAMRPAHKDRENPYFKSTYATLQSVFEALRDPFADNGLVLIQPPGKMDELGNVVVTTMIAHESGEWISGAASAKPVKNDPQGVGSVISYLRRYGAQSMSGLPSADDDGNAATHAAPPPPRKDKPSTSSPSKQTPTTTASPKTTYENADLKKKEWLLSELKKEKVPQDLWKKMAEGMEGAEMKTENVKALVLTISAFGNEGTVSARPG